MLEKLTIKNLQSHRHTTLDFNPGINVIVGKSQSGKTAILRALYWLFFNRPSGLRIRTQGNERPVRVSAVMDGKTVALFKGKNSKYSLDESEWKGFNKSVPADVETFLNIDDINIQRQLDEHFLITSSPQEVARTINQITGLEKVDEWTKKLTTKINTLSTKKDLIVEDKEKLVKKLKVFDDIDELDTLYKNAEKLDRQIFRRKDKYVKLNQIIIDREKVNSKLAQINAALKAENDIKKAIKFEEKRVLAVKQQKIIEKYIASKNRLTALLEAVETISFFLANAEAIQLQIDEKRKVVDAIDAVEFAKHALKNVDIDHRKVLKKYTDLLKKSGECPTCFSNVSKSMLEKIAKKL
jgi:exonuclease SbcC